MNETQPIYLSPAFSNRTDEELRFLSTINGATGFSLFWIDIVKPLLCKLNAKHLLEIGAETGEHTRLLLEYCSGYDANLTIIEPVIRPELRDIIVNLDYIKLFAGKSQTVLPEINFSVDAVFLEGDLNYCAVHHDLLEIEKISRRQSIPFPIVFARSLSWPYARRDMYYDPKGMPAECRHDYDRMGITPWSPRLHEGMINFPYANAKKEGGYKNGVRTAIEDFVKDSELKLRLFTLPVNYGLGIIYTENSQVDEFVKNNLFLSQALRLFLETCELARLNEIIHRLKTKQCQQQSQLKSNREWRNRLIQNFRRLGRMIIRMIEK